MNWPTSDEQIIEDIVLVNEGSFTDNPVDPGGPTNFGVTLHTYSGFLGRPATTDELKAMTQACENGAILMPPVPAFYARPQTLDDMVNHTVGRCLDLFDIETDLVSRWAGMGKTGDKS